jgi:hypothetical protein
MWWGYIAAGLAVWLFLVLKVIWYVHHVLQRFLWSDLGFVVRPGPRRISLALMQCWPLQVLNPLCLLSLACLPLAYSFVLLLLACVRC